MKQPPLLLLNTHQHASDTHRCVRVHTDPHVFSLFFFFYLNKSIWQPKPQRSPMHGFTPRLGSHQNKLKALRESQKKKKSERLRETEREEKNTKKPNNLSALTTIPHCHLHITPLPLPPPLPHPILSPAQLPIWKETGRNDIMHMKMSRKMFDLCMH